MIIFRQRLPWRLVLGRVFSQTADILLRRAALTMPKTILLNFLWLFLLAANLKAQEPPVIVMHRSGAGQRDETGWTDAKSTEGKYSVRLPVQNGVVPGHVANSLNPHAAFFFLRL